MYLFGLYKVAPDNTNEIFLIESAHLSAVCMLL